MPYIAVLYLRETFLDPEEIPDERLETFFLNLNEILFKYFLLQQTNYFRAKNHWTQNTSLKYIGLVRASFL
jgi:hypothetical protein